jgi:hypothetical protein
MALCQFVLGLIMSRPSAQMEMQPPAYEAPQEIDSKVYDVLTREMMKETFGDLFIRYKKDILGSLPALYTLIGSQLLFLSKDTDTHPIAYAGYDTWDSPINQMNHDQLRAGLSALTFLSRKIQKQLAAAAQGPASSLEHQLDFAPLVQALNNMGPIRGALLTRKADLQAATPSSSPSSSRSSGYGTMSKEDSFFIDYFFYWNSHQHCYHSHPCAYDYHHGIWTSPSYVHHEHSAWHLGEIPVSKLGKAFGNQVIKPTAQGVTEIFGRIFDTRLQIRQGMVDLGGRMIDLAGTALNRADHVLDCREPCYIGAKTLGEGCGDLWGGCGDIMKVFEHSCCEVLSCLSQVPSCHCGDVGCPDCKCSGDAGELLTVVCGGVASCCYGTFSLVSKICKGKKPHSPPAAEAVARRASVLDPLTDHPYYNLGGWVLTGVNLGCCTLPLVISQVHNCRVITGNTATERQRWAAKIDCCIVTTATGAMALAGTFCFSSAVWGPKVIINTLTAVGTSAKAASKMALDHHTAKHHEGVLEPELYFLTAAELNALVDQHTPQGQEPWDTLGKIAKNNTGFMQEAEAAKNAQSAPMRHLRALPGLLCLGYLNCTNGDERRHNSALNKIAGLRKGILSETMTTFRNTY